MRFSSAGGRRVATKSLQHGQMGLATRATRDACRSGLARYTGAIARPWDAGSLREIHTHRWGDHMSPDHGASPARAPDRTPPRRRSVGVAATLAAAIAVVLATAAAAAA